MSRALVAAVVLVGLAAGCKKDAPAVPAVDEATWQATVAAAAPAVASGPPDELARAVSLVQELKGLPTLTVSSREEADRLVDELPAPALEAVEALVRWDQAGGRLPPRTCVADARPYAMMQVARIALLVSADDLSAPPVVAAMGLASRLRAEGQSVLEGTVGAAIADALLDWSNDLGVPPGEAARRYQPTEDGLRRIIAAEAVCSYALFDLLRQPDQADQRDAVVAARRAVDGHVSVEAALTTEGNLLRRYWLETLADLAARPADPAAADRRIAERAERIARDVRKHPVVSLVGPATSRMIERLREYDDDYRRWLAAAPPPPPTPAPAPQP